MRYDAAIIGAGANGLAAAAHLALAGLGVIVIERESQAGGRLQTRQFRPGFFASPFMDAVPEIPPLLATMLDLDVRPIAPAADPAGMEVARARVFDEAALRRPLLARLRAARSPDLSGGAKDFTGPIAMPRIEPVRGGLGTLAQAFVTAALAAGVELRLGLPAADLLLEKNLFGRRRAAGVRLADGGTIEAGIVISTLDLPHSMFSWNDLPAALLRDARACRFAGRTARLLLALDRPAGEALALAGDADVPMRWQQGLLPAQPPLCFDPVSLRDPTLAPPSAAVATVTLDYIPCRLSQGAWTHRRRIDLAAQTLARLAPHRPDLLRSLRAVEIIVPPDIEAALGIIDGDLDGGIGLVPEPGPRTALPRFYLGGPGTRANRLGTGAAGLAAALAVLAD